MGVGAALCVRTGLLTIEDHCSGRLDAKVNLLVCLQRSALLPSNPVPPPSSGIQSSHGPLETVWKKVCSDLPQTPVILEAGQGTGYGPVLIVSLLRFSFVTSGKVLNLRIMNLPVIVIGLKG